MKNQAMYNRTFKRLIDIILSLILIFLSCPIMIFAILFILLFQGWPVFFIQERPGRNEKLFKMFKFRTMKNLLDRNNKPLSDAERITRLGWFLRKTSIDEVPELFNILRGDMSFVGPRPLLPEYLPYYTKEERLRHSVRPGLTGLAQVSGRSRLDWNMRLKLDQEYVNNISFVLDAKILVLTLVNTILLKDIAVIPSTVGRKLSETRQKDDSFNG